MEETRHTHHYPPGRGGPIDTPPSLTHDHDRGLDGHDHSEEIEVVIGRLLVKRNYTGLTPRDQRIVAIGIAAMRRAVRDVIFARDATAAAYPPPTTGELRAPLVTRTKGERQTPAQMAADARAAGEDAAAVLAERAAARERTGRPDALERTRRGRAK